MKFVIAPSKKGHGMSKVLSEAFIASSCRHVSIQVELFWILQSHVVRNGWSQTMTVPLCRRGHPTRASFSLPYLKEALAAKLTCWTAKAVLQNLSWHLYFLCRCFACLVGGFLSLPRCSCCSNTMSNGNSRFWEKNSGTGNIELERK